METFAGGRPVKRLTDQAVNQPNRLPGILMQRNLSIAIRSRNSPDEGRPHSTVAVRPIASYAAKRGNGVVRKTDYGKPALVHQNISCKTTRSVGIKRGSEAIAAW